MADEWFRSPAWGEADRANFEGPPDRRRAVLYRTLPASIRSVDIFEVLSHVVVADQSR